MTGFLKLPWRQKWNSRAGCWAFLMHLPCKPAHLRAYQSAQLSVGTSVTPLTKDHSFLLLNQAIDATSPFTVYISLPFIWLKYLCTISVFYSWLIFWLFAQWDELFIFLSFGQYYLNLQVVPRRREGLRRQSGMSPDGTWVFFCKFFGNEMASKDVTEVLSLHITHYILHGAS